MTKPSVITRRGFLSSIIAGAVGTSIQSYRDSHSDNSLQISLYQTDFIAEKVKNDTGNKNTILKNCQVFLKEKLSKIDDDINIKINILTPTIPKIELRKSSTFDDWQEYAKDVSGLSNDANILLTDLDNEHESGRAELPCSCHRNRATIGIVYNAYKLIDYDPKNTSNHVDYIAQDRFIKLMHEVGHNLGLTHEMGYVNYNEKDDCIYVSPMMNSYVSDQQYVGKKNHFGQHNIDPREKQVIVRPTVEYNSKITVKNITNV